MKKILIALVVALALPFYAFADTATVSVQQVVKAGLATSYTASGLVAATRTYQFSNDGRVFLHLKKTGAGACVVTVVTQATSQGYAIEDQVISVAATTGDELIGPFAASLFNDASELVSFTLSDTVGLSIAAFRL